MGSSGSTDTSSQQQSVSQTQLPPWVNQAAQQNYALAQNVAAAAADPVPGPAGRRHRPADPAGVELGGARREARAPISTTPRRPAFLTAAGTPATQVTRSRLAGTNLRRT